MEITYSNATLEDAYGISYVSAHSWKETYAGLLPDKYLDNSLANPTFLFHGSPKKLEVIEQRQAYDSNGIKEN